MSAIVIILRRKLGNSVFISPCWNSLYYKAEVELLPAHAFQFDVTWVLLLGGTVFARTFCPETEPASIKKINMLSVYTEGLS